MRTNQVIITHIPPTMSAITVAAGCYEKWGGDMNFMEDLVDHLLNGIVINMPHVFALGKFVKVQGYDEPVLFCRMAVGRLIDLLPFIIWSVKWISFCRRNDKRLRVYDVARLRLLAYKLAAKGK